MIEATLHPDIVPEKMLNVNMIGKDLVNSCINNLQKIIKKRVSFLPQANVVLIPTLDEYHSAGLAPRLWWNDCDFRAFKTSAAREVQQFLKDKPHINSKGALKLYCEQLGKDEEPKQPLVEVPVIMAPCTPIPSVKVITTREPTEIVQPVVNNANIVINEPIINNEINNTTPTTARLPPLPTINNSSAVIIVTTNTVHPSTDQVCVGNMNVHIITYDRIRSDSLTNNPRRSTPNNNTPVLEMEDVSSSSSSSGNDAWTVFNLLPDNRSSETFAILAQLIALASLSMIQSN